MWVANAPVRGCKNGRVKPCARLHACELQLNLSLQKLQRLPALVNATFLRALMSMKQNGGYKTGAAESLPAGMENNLPVACSCDHVDQVIQETGTRQQRFGGTLTVITAEMLGGQGGALEIVQRESGNNAGRVGRAQNVPDGSGVFQRPVALNTGFRLNSLEDAVECTHVWSCSKYRGEKRQFQKLKLAW
jgi:hypothetical protein